MFPASHLRSFFSVSQYDRGFGPADWWSVRPGWFHTKSRLQCVARLRLRWLEQWELPKWICGNHVWVWSHTKLHHHESESPYYIILYSQFFMPLRCARSPPIYLSRSTATTCSRSTSRPSARWCVTSAQSQTGRPRRSPSAPWWTRRTPVPASSPSTWPITWPVPSSASSTLLMPGCCSVRSPSSQVQIIQLFVKALTGSFTFTHVCSFTNFKLIYSCKHLQNLMSAAHEEN